ncbi:unnamed protein product, partial [Closterium sp. Yama58-4]
RVLQDLQQAWGQNFSGWVAGGDCSLASNVTCDAQGMVTNIWLSYRQLTGSIPDSISALNRMTYLALSVNALSGSIPSTIGKMSSLKRLDLWNNKLNGSIPSTIDSMSNLTHL